MRRTTIDMTILKEIYYSTYLPKNISCTNDITAGYRTKRQLTFTAPLHSSH